MSTRLFSHRIVHERKGSPRPWFPEDIRKFLIRRTAEAAGLAVLLGAGALWLSLFTYHSSDPSLNTAGDELIIRNWMGIAGSYAADLLRQTFGLGSYFLVLLLIAWAWRVASLRGLR